MQRGRKAEADAPMFGKRLAELRKERGMTQQELADALGITRDLVGHYERRSNNPNLDFVLKVAELFGTGIDELLGLAEEPKRKPGPSPRVARLAESIAKLPKAKQAVILDMVEGAIGKQAS